jgi:hypothetical protein
MAWAQQRRLPRWSPYAAVAVVVLWTVLLVMKCSGGGAADKAKPAPGHGPAKAAPHAAPHAAPSGNEIEMDEDVVQPPKKR